MKQVLEPLSLIPGVRMALLVSPDGVPVVVRGRSNDERGVDLSSESGESLAALASGWLNGLTRAIAPQSWDVPQRVVLRAARGTLVMLAAPGAVLLVQLDRGASSEDLRLPMESAVVRMLRFLRGNRPAAQQTVNPSQSAGSRIGPGSAIPSRDAGKGPRLAPTDTSCQPGSGA
jgi:predicted regulator of Ras-like GTPase activity (Roadblock/LC7/MglB family)